MAEFFGRALSAADIGEEDPEDRKRLQAERRRLRVRQRYLGKKKKLNPVSGRESPASSETTATAEELHTRVKLRRVQKTSPPEEAQAMKPMDGPVMAKDLLATW